MMEAKIIDRGRGPEIAGTRITVYTILEYMRGGWRRDDIAFWLSLRKDQLAVAIRYIEEHEEEVTTEYEKIMERINRGNSPELQEKLDAVHGTARARLKELRRSLNQGPAHWGHSGGQ
jgi:uncharacterized protein (DUF433 family)